MSSSKKSSKTYSTKLSLDSMAGGSSSGLEVSEMPAGQMPGSTAAGMAGLSETEMPAGDMNQSARSTPSGAMPSGHMTETTTSNMGQSGGGNGLAITEMPIGRMTGAATNTMMPSGNVKASEKSESETGGLPVLEIAGEWRLTLSSTSIKNS